MGHRSAPFYPAAPLRHLIRLAIPMSRRGELDLPPRGARPPRRGPRVGRRRDDPRRTRQAAAGPSRPSTASSRRTPTPWSPASACPASRPAARTSRRYRTASVLMVAAAAATHRPRRRAGPHRRPLRRRRQDPDRGRRPALASGPTASGRAAQGRRRRGELVAVGARRLGLRLRPGGRRHRAPARGDLAADRLGRSGTPTRGEDLPGQAAAAAGGGAVRAGRHGVRQQRPGRGPRVRRPGPPDGAAAGRPAPGAAQPLRPPRRRRGGRPAAGGCGASTARRGGGSTRAGSGAACTSGGARRSSRSSVGSRRCSVWRSMSGTPGWTTTGRSRWRRCCSTNCCWSTTA